MAEPVIVELESQGDDRQTGADISTPTIWRPAARRVSFDVMDAIVPSAAARGFAPTGDVTVGTPNRDDYYRAHPDPALVRTFYIYKDRLGGGLYLVSAKIVSEMGEEVQKRTLYPLIDWRGSTLLWAVIAPTPGGRLDPWSRDAHELVDDLRHEWGRVISGPKGYRIQRPEDRFPEPVWPQDLDLRDLIERAFAYTNIDSLDHPIVRRLKGRLA